MNKKHKTVPIFVPHLGCPCNCLFCDQKKITGVQEAMTPEKAAVIMQKAISCKKEDEILEVGFFGGSFTGIPAQEQEALLSVAHRALLQGEIDGIRLSTRPDYINKQVLDRLLRFGVTTIELGAQSMDDAVLALCRRGHNARQTEEAAKRITESGIQLGLQMMIGLPGDTPEKTIQTAEKFAALQPACVRIYPTLVIRGTDLDGLYQKGAYSPLSVAEAVAICSRLYQFFTARGIHVIRMGLLQMATEDVSAGPVHPAFGELVMSAVCYEKICEALEGFSGDELYIRVNPRYVSILCGQKKENITRLLNAYHFHKIHIKQDDAVAWGDFILQAQAT